MRKPDDLERPKCFNFPIEYHSTKVFGLLGFGIPWIRNKRGHVFLDFYILSIVLLNFQPFLNVSKLTLIAFWGKYEIEVSRFEPLVQK